MIEPMMNAIPARKNSLPTTSAAAAMLSAKPVSEIALGVSRDSIRRSFISAWVALPLRRGRPERSGRAGGGLVCSAISALPDGALEGDCDGRHGQAVAWPNAQASGLARA